MRGMLAAGVMTALLGCCGACSRGADAAKDTELADAMSEPDEATAASFTGPPLAVCQLLATAEVEAAIGPLAGPARLLPEQADDTSDGRCEWRGSEERVLQLAGAREGGTERLAALEPHAAAVNIAGSWDQARLQGCCVLHAVREEALLSLDFSAARLPLEKAATLMNAALARVHEPLEVR